ncbi:MAG: hypothetical protein OEL56_03625 [Nitrosopumilus sp.]|nr:hypothetical protein [Nitrosopumilus sp.]MDH3489516.1 hypothetical protein [Nitrosopumilus sp.]MDH3516514.1 hypothetical protein [Nitrosopumilus sp.]MDH3564980.1 hypothetical protein [Nitrosopumilus sp.]MDH5416403.1 hypothetical protein [Nitrosopumilus sp.]
MSDYVVEKLISKRTSFLNVNTFLKITLGLVLFTILSFALVYAETISVDVDGTTYDVEYTATGMTVSAIEADLDFISLILAVDVTDSPGILDITLDRSFFDSTFNGLDEDFIILADGTEPTFTETTSNSQSRILRIDLPSGTEDVEIIGSAFGNPSIPVEEPVIEEPVIEEPVIEEPVIEEPVIEEPVIEEPVIEEPVIDDNPIVTTPKIQCGPGTILKDGACVLDQRCGPGTILKDGTCVLDSTSKPTQTSVKGMGKELVMGVVVAFIVAGTVGLILGIMSKASKSN